MSGTVSKVVLTIGGSNCSTTAGSTTVGIAHSFVSDLQLTLIAPDGTSVLFMNKVGGGGHNICQAVFDDTAGANIQTVLSDQAPFTGTWQPANPFSALNGVDPNGTWKLQAQDFFPEDSGTIQAFSLAIETVQAFALGAHTMAVSGSGAPGSTMTYTTTIGNNGASASSDNPGSEYVDALPSGLTLVSASSDHGTALASIGTNTVGWNGSIPAGGTVTITTLATVNSDATGTVSNQGTVNYDSDDNGTNDASAVTDDPATGASDDATTFTVADVTPPSVTLTRSASATSAAHIPFTVTFSEPVTGFTPGDVVLGGTAGADAVAVTGSGAHYTVTVSGMTRSGTVTAFLPAGAAQDVSGNPSTASGADAVSVRYTKLPSLAFTGADPRAGVLAAAMLLMLGLAVLGGAGLLRRRRTEASS
jgi:uncharacterized repeat protein (TIGR01451 family)